MNTTTKIGYARVSTANQSDQLQTQALERAGCYEVYTDHGRTGRTMARPQLEVALKALRPGDTLTVWKLDRLGRNVRGLCELLEELEHRGIFFESLTEGIDTSTSVGKLMFHILAAVAEMESNLVSERTKAGLAALREKNGGSGAGPGRPSRLSEVQRLQLVTMRSQVNPVTGKVWTIRELAGFFSVGNSTVIRNLEKHGS